MTPDWAFQLLWFGAGIGGTGAIWYFLSQHHHHTALWTGFATVVVVVFTIALHIRNDLIKREQPTLGTATSSGKPAPSLAQPQTAPLGAQTDAAAGIQVPLSGTPRERQQPEPKSAVVSKRETKPPVANEPQSSHPQRMGGSPGSLLAGRDVSKSPDSAERPTPSAQDQAVAQLQSAVRKVLRFPHAVPDSPASQAMVERLFLDQTPRKLFDVLMRYDEGDIGRIPELGALLQEFLRKYYQFEQEAVHFEGEVLKRIGGTVTVRFRQGWVIYLRYAILRFGGMSKEEVIAGGDFLNFEITWDDAERVFVELSNDKLVSRRFRDMFAEHKSFIETANKLKGSI